MISIVVPTAGRPSLARLLAALAPQITRATVPVELLVVPDPARRGPASARNRGTAAARHDWVAFLDDDVVPAPDWLERLVADLRVPAAVAGVAGRIRVPPPPVPDDWAWVTAALAGARWATADMAYRRRVLAEVGGFDERFPRAYREDADLAHRVRRLGYRLVDGDREVTHPVRRESRWVSLRTQRGNADDALLRRLYGREWHELLDAPAGRRHRHAATVAVGVLAVALPAAALAGRVARKAGAGHGRGRQSGAGRRPGAGRGVRRPATGGRLVAPGTLAAAATWLAATGEFVAARRRAAPASDPVALVVTSVLIPPLAVGHWLAGWWRHRHAQPWSPGTQARVAGERAAVRARRR